VLRPDDGRGQHLVLGGGGAVDAAFGSSLYSAGEQGELPAEAVAASLGCGNPLVVAELRAGERVLDLGSGGDIDVLLSARRVGDTGFAYGVDMTDEMLALARVNATKAGVRNVEFRKGTIENIPLPDHAVDVVISNCVINLSTDKPALLAEMFRVLTPGGRVGVSDVVAEDHLTPADRAERGSYVGCIAGALTRAEYLDGLIAAGSSIPRWSSTTKPPPACTGRSSGPPNLNMPAAHRPSSRHAANPRQGRVLRHRPPCGRGAQLPMSDLVSEASSRTYLDWNLPDPAAYPPSRCDRSWTTSTAAIGVARRTDPTPT